MHNSIKAVTRDKFNEKILKAVKEYLKNQGWEEMTSSEEKETWYINRKGSKLEMISLNVNEETQGFFVIIFPPASSEASESEPVEEQEAIEVPIVG